MNDEQFLKLHAPRFYSFLKTVFPKPGQLAQALAALKKELTRDLSDPRFRGKPSCQS